MNTKKVTINAMPLDLYNRLVLMCKADKRSLNNGLQVLLQEAADRYFKNQERLLKGKNHDV